MRDTTEMPPTRRELKLALIHAHYEGARPAAWLQPDPGAARALRDLARALDAARHGPAPTAAEVARAAGWLRLALWRAHGPARPQ
jgi:hypothetical protein